MDKKEEKMMAKDKNGGWNWIAFILGPFWYLSRGMISKGVWLLVLCFITIFFAVPFIWVYCGAKGQEDWYEHQLRERSKNNLNRV